MALPAGLLGIGTILALLVVISRLVHLPEGPPLSAPAGMPAPTMFALLTMQSIVAGVTEESAFRGYMQSHLERIGPTFAILVTSAAFTLLHVSHWRVCLRSSWGKAPKPPWNGRTSARSGKVIR